MHESYSRWKIRNQGVSEWAIMLVCMAAAAGCSGGGQGAGKDGGVAGTTGIGGTTAATSGGGAIGTGGSGGLAQAGSLAGTTGLAGMTGGAGTVAGTGTTGGAGAGGTTGATGGRSLLPPGAGATGGAHSTGGVTSVGGGTGGASATMGTGGSASGGTTGSKYDGGISPAPDAQVRTDGTPGEMPTIADFMNGLAGVWLVGTSSGSVRHYSWLRLSGELNGDADYLSGADLPSNTPFWACDGKATWFLSDGIYSIMLRAPSACPKGTGGLVTFRGVPDTAVPPAGAILGLLAPGLTSSQPSAEWWKFPDNQCDAAMTTCKSPF